jgi:hypothetical protein
MYETKVVCVVRFIDEKVNISHIKRRTENESSWEHVAEGNIWT